LLAILIRAGCFVAIILGGIVLRKKNFLPKESFAVLSKIVINITLPAAIISGNAGKPIDPAMLLVVLVALLAGVGYMLIAALVSRKKSREEQAFRVVNLPGYNIGNFAMPFTQNFLGPLGIVTTSLFDIGNAVVCLGGAYGAASAIKDGKGFDLKRIVMAPFKSIPFLTYLIMAVLNLLALTPPGPIVELAGIVGSANPFLGMLMVGVGFRLSADREKLRTAAELLALRYGFATILAVITYFALPFDLEVRQAMVLLYFSPIGSAIPAFTGRLGGDVGLSSAINSISVVCSIALMVLLQIIML
jgi:predicted permease